MNLERRFYRARTIIKAAQPATEENLVIPFSEAMLLVKSHLAAKGIRLSEQDQPSAEQLAELMKEALNHG